MAACEKCWSDAFRRTLDYPPLDQPMKSQIEHYYDLLRERKDNPCTPKEQAGQWWDEEKQCDSRKDRKMNGIQKTVHDGLRYLARQVAEGHYGEGDNAFDESDRKAFFRKAFLEDLKEQVIDKTE